MARYCIPAYEDPSKEVPERTTEEDEMPAKKHKPSTESMVRSLSHLTLTRSKNEKGPLKEVLNN